MRLLVTNTIRGPYSNFEVFVTSTEELKTLGNLLSPSTQKRAKAGILVAYISRYIPFRVRSPRDQVQSGAPHFTSPPSPLPSRQAARGFYCDAYRYIAS
ncbi:hypothetical protein CC2G_000202 [Coprinopsis cinerea AmutBmut pab1-1]|nr:hypothetical protein CC2G_000202 [Coprinopsis cinerea AmutBmut pab1-1]